MLGVVTCVEKVQNFYQEEESSKEKLIIQLSSNALRYILKMLKFVSLK